ncbi:Thioredoxin-like fold,Peroxiredoxin, AhpC-type,Alkyl hydroperoxide reductase subunit C/ Thiol [Cinara cedri]|uniref:thioredoxin-dependent peroxiredoxin n=1 Tax=Cinara cedri TaxID=506608 RepID=A0A5E4M7V9_9HEMI|nr:Thioredoxin-like fold,Peroxiredoxin, AhpC-type,Alkyl hydroperoxide reductase subunit C/ Thiol [Cinara cedri]
MHFKKREIEVVGVSFDSVFTHNAWRQVRIKKGGIGVIQYSMITDIKREIIKAYDIEHPNSSVTLRGSFLIDTISILRHQVINDLPLGHNIDEMIRMIDALQFYENMVTYVLHNGKKAKKECILLLKELLNIYQKI